MTTLRACVLLLALLNSGCLTLVTQRGLGPDPTAHYHGPLRALRDGDTLRVEVGAGLNVPALGCCTAPPQVPATLVYDLRQRDGDEPLRPIEVVPGPLPDALPAAPGQRALVVSAAGRDAARVALGREAVAVSLAVEPPLRDLHVVAVRCLAPLTLGVDLALTPLYGLWYLAGGF